MIYKQGVLTSLAIFCFRTTPSCITSRAPIHCTSKAMTSTIAFSNTLCFKVITSISINYYTCSVYCMKSSLSTKKSVTLYYTMTLCSVSVVVLCLFPCYLLLTMSKSSESTSVTDTANLVPQSHAIIYGNSMTTYQSPAKLL